MTSESEGVWHAGSKNMESSVQTRVVPLTTYLLHSECLFTTDLMTVVHLTLSALILITTCTDHQTQLTIDLDQYLGA